MVLKRGSQGTNGGGARHRRRRPRHPLRWAASLLALAIVVTLLPMRSDAWVPPDPTEWRQADYELLYFRNDYLYMAPDSSGTMREHRGCEKVYVAKLDGADGLEGRGQYQPPADWRVRVGRKSIPGGGLFILGARTTYFRIDGTQLPPATAPSGKPYVYYGIWGRTYKGENSGNVRDRCDRLDIERPDAEARAELEDFELWTSVPNENPYVSFQYEESDTVERQVRFTNRSVDPDGDTAAMSYQWEFGDGTRSSEKDPVHTYAADGDYTVRLFAYDDDGGVAQTTQVIEIGGPPLEGALFAFPSGDLTIKEGDRQGVRLRVENDGDQPLKDVAITSTVLTPVDDEGTGLLTIAPTAGGEVLSGSLGTGAEKLDFADFDVVAKEAGEVEVAMTVEAELPDDTPVEAVIKTVVTIEPAPIKVDLEVHYAEPPGGATEPAEFQKDNNGDGEVDARDHRIEIEVTATNASEEPVSAVEVRDAAEPIDFDDKYLGGGEVYLDPLDLPVNTEFGALEPGASETLTFAYEAKEPVWADATTIVEGRIGADPGQLVTGVGRTVVKLDTDLALEAYMDLDERPYSSGQVVRLTGRIKNIMEDKVLDDGTVRKAKSLSVVLDPIVEENASNGYVFPGDFGGRTPQGNTAYVLAPGEARDVAAIVQTARSGQPTNAHVRYLVHAWEIDDEDPEALATKIDQSRIVIDDDDGHGTEFTTPLQPVQLKPDKLEECETEILDAVITCNLWVGLREFGTGLAQLGPVILTGTKEWVRAGWGIRAWMFQQWSNYVRAVLGDPAAMQRIITEIEVQMETFRQAKLMSKEAFDAIGASVVEFFQEAETALKTGDTNQIVAWSARFLGENPDLGFAAITKVRAARALFGTALPSGSQSEATVALAKAAEDAQAVEKATLQTKVDEAIAKGEDPTRNGTFKGDEDVTDNPGVFRSLYGARKTELNHMLELAKKENILIAFRARAGRAADLIRDGLARQKPMDVKTKGVNEIDINYLGYRREAKDLVELVEPPIDWRLVDNELAFDVELDLYMDFLKTKHPELKVDAVWAAEVRGRLKTRTKQWVKEVPNFKRYEEQGIDVGFGYKEQGLPESLDDQFEQLRKARVNEGFVKDPYTGEMRRYYNVEMADANGENFLPITGDIDIVAILNSDRSPLTDVTKRTRVYRELAKLVGMQHGDSFSWINNKGMIEFMREHIAGKAGSEALVVAGSDGRARMGYFEERLSTVTDADGNEVSKTTFHMLTGGPRELITDPAGGIPVNRVSYFDQLSGYTLDPKFYLPGALEDFMDGVDAAGLAPPPFDPFAGAIQPDGEGGAVIYQDGGTEGDEARSPSVGAAGRAGRADEDSLDALVAEIAAAGFGPAPKPDQGAQGGRWVPYDAAARAADSPSGRFPRGVMSALDGAVPAGSKVLPITPLSDLGMAAGSPWFKVGDQIVVDPGGRHEERHVVASVSPFATVSPLANDQLHATSVVLIPRTRVVPADPTDPTTPTPPTTPTDPTAPVTIAPAAPGGAGGDESAGGATAAPATSTGSLPRTGSGVTDVLPLALALVLGGIGILAIRARTRRRVAA